jgi:flagellar protein FliS
LYFLCTTRLLQANARLDVQQLDSVVGILSGLRGAYAQIVNTPEAQAAAAQISARQNPQENSLAKRNVPIMNQNAPAPPAAMGRLQAQAAYQTMTMEPAQAATENAPVSQAMPPAGAGRGVAAYGKLAARG